MLNALKLSGLLAKNVNPQLYPRMFIMSPNGTLMAYSTPVDIKELRDQAALISMAWKEQALKHSSQTSKDPNNTNHSGDLHPTTTSPSPSPSPSHSPDLETLTIETQNNNILIRAIQPNLLLVLVGGIPPSRRNVFKITPEAKGDPRYPPADSETGSDASALAPTSNPTSENPGTSTSEEQPAPKRRTPSLLSSMSQRDRDIKSGVLHIQRKKLDALTDYIRKDFNAKGFVMPDDSSFP